MNRPLDQHSALRRTCIGFTALQIVGFAVGCVLFMGSFGICGPTGLFDLAVPVLVASSGCLIANLSCLRRLKRSGAKDLDVLAAWAWIGAPGVLLTLVILLFLVWP